MKIPTENTGDLVLTQLTAVYADKFNFLKSWSQVLEMMIEIEKHAYLLCVNDYKWVDSIIFCNDYLENEFLPYLVGLWICCCNYDYKII